MAESIKEHIFVCEQCGRSIFQEKVIRMTDINNVVFVFCSIPCGQDYFYERQCWPSHQSLSMMQLYKGSPIKLG